MKIKLKEYAENNNIKYITAYRWFKSGFIPGAFRTPTGTILIEVGPDEDQATKNAQSNDVMSAILKKTVECSKNNSTVEDFAAWILSNFNLKFITDNEKPVYSRAKPKSEDVQKHFQQFIKPKGEKPKMNMFIADDSEALDDMIIKSDDLTAKELVEEINKIGAESGEPINLSDTPEVSELMKDLSSAIYNPSSMFLNVKTYDNVAEGVVLRSVDLTPQQQLNYIGSTNSAFSNCSISETGIVAQLNYDTQPANLGSFVGFNPTQKELESSNKILEITDKPKRGRKSFKVKL